MLHKGGKINNIELHLYVSLIKYQSFFI